MCFARAYTLTITYWQVNQTAKQLVAITLAGDHYDTNTTDTHYSLHITYRPLNWLELVLAFQFEITVYLVLFCLIGSAMLIVSFLAWVVNRATTHLVNPPDFKIWSLLQLTVPPAVAGTSTLYQRTTIIPPSPYYHLPFIIIILLSLPLLHSPIYRHDIGHCPLLPHALCGQSIRLGGVLFRGRYLPGGHAPLWTHVDGSSQQRVSEGEEKSRGGI